MRNCDTCINFIKIKTWNDKRKGFCNITDFCIVEMKNKNCKYYKSKKYERKSEKGVYNFRKRGNTKV